MLKSCSEEYALFPPLYPWLPGHNSVLIQVCIGTQLLNVKTKQTVLKIPIQHIFEIVPYQTEHVALISPPPQLCDKIRGVEQ